MKAYKTATQIEAEKDAQNRKDFVTRSKAAFAKMGKTYHSHTHISYSFLTQNAKSK